MSEERRQKAPSLARHSLTHPAAETSGQPIFSAGAAAHELHDSGLSSTESSAGEEKQHPDGAVRALEDEEEVQGLPPLPSTAHPHRHHHGWWWRFASSQLNRPVVEPEEKGQPWTGGRFAPLYPLNYQRLSDTPLEPGPREREEQQQQQGDPSAAHHS